MESDSEIEGVLDVEEIVVVGLGPGSFGHITMEAWEALTGASHLLLKTAKHPVAAELKNRGVQFVDYDALYEEKETPAEADASVAADVAARARRGERVVYAVPGSAVSGEKTVALLGALSADKVPMRVLAGVRFADALRARLGADASDGLTVLDGGDLDNLSPDLPSQRFTLDPLTDVMAKLRSPGGCVWDIEQTHASLRRNLIEEVYEVIEAIDLRDAALLCEELGDLLLQVVFHARMAEEAGHFSMQDVTDGITAKLIRRHPHVFGDITVRDAGEVVLNWDAIKQQEKAKERTSVLDGVPKDLPSLMKAYKLQHKAAKVGFDWDNISFVWDKIREEIAEVKIAIEKGEQTEIEEEFGDCLFSFVNLARFLEIDAEVALGRTNRKFRRRFSHMEDTLRERGLKWADMTLESLDALWEDAKALNL